jgi:hypothetical protein
MLIHAVLFLFLCFFVDGSIRRGRMRTQTVNFSCHDFLSVVRQKKLMGESTLVVTIFCPRPSKKTNGGRYFIMSPF